MDKASEPVSLAANIVAERMSLHYKSRSTDQGTSDLDKGKSLKGSIKDINPGIVSDYNAPNGHLGHKNVASVTPVRLKDLSHAEYVLQGRYWGKRALDDLARCQRCAMDGHVEDFCPARTCDHCGAIDDHYSRACSSYRQCTKCRERGHDAASCRSLLRRSIADGFSCDLCQGSHPEEECSWIWRTFNPKLAPLKQKSNDLVTHCYNCGSDRHFGGDCPGLALKSISHNANDTFTWAYASLFFSSSPKDKISRGFAIRGRAEDQQMVTEEFSGPEVFHGKKVHTPPARAQMRISGLAVRMQQDDPIQYQLLPDGGVQLPATFSNTWSAPSDQQVSARSQSTNHFFSVPSQPPLPNEPLPDRSSDQYRR